MILLESVLFYFIYRIIMCIQFQTLSFQFNVYTPATLFLKGRCSFPNLTITNVKTSNVKLNITANVNET